MKIAEYKQMMEYLTRPAFKIGGSVDKPKRGLVDEPGSYSRPSKEMKKIAEKNIAAWKKANPDLNYDDLALEAKTRVRAGSTTAGTFKAKPPGIYTIEELAKLEGMPYGKETLKSNLIGKGDNNTKKIFKKAGAEFLPKIKAGEVNRFKVTNAKDFVQKVMELSMDLPNPPRKLYEPYKKLIRDKYKELIDSKKRFSKTDLRELVFNDLPEGTIKITDKSFNRMINKNLNKNELKKFTPGQILTPEKKLEPRKKIVDSILNGKTNIDELSKVSGLSKQEVGDQIQALFRTIYSSREKIGAKEKVKDSVLKNYSLKDFEKILSGINKEPTLDSFFRKAYRDLLFNAIGNPNNPDTYQPKKYARALERLGGYFKVRTELLNKFGVNLELDHSLSVGAIKKIQNNQPSQFLRVNPIPEEINRGIKSSFDTQYQNVIKNLQSGKFRGEQLKNLLMQKAELEKLSKDIGLPFGKMSPTGKIIKYDAVDFLNKNLPSEIKAGVSLPNRIRQAVDKMDPTVLKERFKVAFGDKADDALKVLDKIKNQDNLQDILKFLKPLLSKGKGFGKALGADASDVLNKISDAIVSPVAAAEVLPNEAQAATSKPMDFDLDMSLPGKPPRRTPDELAMLAVPAAKSFKNVLGKTFTRLGTLGPVGAFALADPMSAIYAMPFLKAGSEQSGIFKKPKGPIQAVTRFINRIPFLGPGASKAALGTISRGSVPGAIGMGIYDITKRSKPNMFIGSDGEPTFYSRDKADQVLPSMISEFERKYDLAKEKNIPFESVVTNMRDLKAGGGIMKMAGKPSGPAPESGPTPQGLDFLMKRGR